jgi:hypothetical protein
MRAAALLCLAQTVAVEAAALISLRASCHRLCSRSHHPVSCASEFGRSDAAGGHVFVVHGDLTRLLADAVLIPTRNTLDGDWFPAGPPAGLLNPSANAFTSARRVHLLDGSGEDGRRIYLGHVDGRRASNFVGKNPRTGRPGVDWFVQAAYQFLVQATADFTAREGHPVGGRIKPLFALPVIGSGNGGARTASGKVIARLLLLLEQFVLEYDVDVVLVVKSARMFSAAQAHRRHTAASDPAAPSQSDCGALTASDRGAPRWQAKLGARLCDAATELATLATSEQLALFLGAGVSVGAGLPAWQQLLTSLAERGDVPITAEEVCGGFGGRGGRGRWGAIRV